MKKQVKSTPIQNHRVGPDPDPEAEIPDLNPGPDFKTDIHSNVFQRFYLTAGVKDGSPRFLQSPNSLLVGL